MSPAPDVPFLQQARQVCTQWDLGLVEAIDPVPGGLIHHTFHVQTDRGHYCLQALHPKLATDEILADWEAVCLHLADRAVPAPRPVPSPGGKAWIEIEGRRWRMSTWLEGHTTEQVDTPEQAGEAARLFGRFYKEMRDIPHGFLSSHPLHDTAFHSRMLRRALDDLSGAADSDVTGDDLITSHRREILELGKACLDACARLALPADLPTWIVHGDPKISNLLFCGKQACGILDLDTAGPHSILVDLGDALRSWAMDGPEDQCRGVRMDVIASALEGWHRTGLRLSAAEVTLLPDAPALISWELAGRFCRDVIEDDYFGWDPSRHPSRRAHNLARTQSMVRLARAFEAHRNDLAETAQKLFARNSL